MPVVPKRKVLILTDESGENIKEEVFFYPVFRRSYCFQDFSDEIAAGGIPVNTAHVICCLGAGFIHKLGKLDILQQMQQLVKTLKSKQEVQIWISTLLPTPARNHVVGSAMMRFNSAMSEVVHDWCNMGCNINIINTHQFFLDEV